MPIRAVLFDIGGVLEANPRTGWQTRWARRLRLSATVFMERLAPIWRQGSLGTLTLEQVESAIGEAFGIDSRIVTALMDDAWAEYLGTLNTDLADYFAGLRSRYRTGIISNSFVGAREREQAKYGLTDLTDVLVYSHEVGVLKPDASIYRLACERLDVTPHEALFLDDVQANVDGALAVGMRAVRFSDTAQAISDVQAELAR